jgi:hypothetical protein
MKAHKTVGHGQIRAHALWINYLSMDERPLGAQTRFHGEKTRNTTKTKRQSSTEQRDGVAVLVVDAIARYLPRYGRIPRKTNLTHSIV